MSWSLTTSSAPRFESALGRYARAYKNALKEVTGAKQTAGQAIPAQLQELLTLYAQGGGYGQGQNALIDQQTKQQLANALQTMVASGMSSGTNALGLQQRVRNDATTQKLNVEDNRINNYAGALKTGANAEMQKRQMLMTAYGLGANTSMAYNDPNFQSYLN
jgi:hypothetical protein